ncbi:unnamed protein product [Musa acuminata var. zebrina]
MAAPLNPHAPVYIPSSFFSPFGSYYSSPLPASYHHPSDTPPSCLAFNQPPVQTTTGFCGATPPMNPFPFCYYSLSPHALPHSAYRTSWKVFACGQIPPMPLHGPKAHERATLTLLSEEEETGGKPEENPVPQTKVKEEVKGGCRAADKARMGFKGSGGGGSFVYRRKAVAPRRSERRRVQALNKKGSVEFEFKKLVRGASEFLDDGKTTVMIKNLPNKFTKEKLLGILDKHCYEENHKLSNDGAEKLSESGGGEMSSAAFSEFDFLYLPIDFTTGSNMGYAFVNFTSAVAAWRLYNFLHNYDWKFHGSRKICEVTYARIQGLPALQKQFRNSTFVCGSDDFLPVCFVPPRNGYCQPSFQFLGRRELPLHADPKA